MQFGKLKNLIKFPSIGNFAIYKNSQIIAICLLKWPNYCNLQIAIYKNGPINAIWQSIKIALNREFVQIYQNGQITATCQIAIYKNGQNAAK
jgi:hypothetical protein